MQENRKKVPQSIGIFGASGHIGGPMAQWLRYHSPQTRLRLITSNEAKVAQLQQEFPGCETVVASYSDLPSMEQAVSGMEGLFVVTPAGIMEEQGTKNLICAVRKSGSLVHLVRLIGMFPNMNPKRIPEKLTKFQFGLETQHPIVYRLLEDSDLPVTYFNVGASYIDNLVKLPIFGLGGNTIAWHPRRVPYIDPRDIGEAAARVLISDNHRHIHQFYTLNNGYDKLSAAELVTLVGEVIQRKINSEPSKEAMMKVMAPAVEHGFMHPDFPEYLWTFLEYEDDNDVAWVLNQGLEELLGRKPNTVRSWLQEHADVLRAKLAG